MNGPNGGIILISITFGKTKQNVSPRNGTALLGLEQVGAVRRGKTKTYSLNYVEPVVKKMKPSKIKEDGRNYSTVFRTKSDEVDETSC